MAERVPDEAGFNIHRFLAEYTAALNYHVTIVRKDAKSHVTFGQQLRALGSEVDFRSAFFAEDYALGQRAVQQAEQAAVSMMASHRPHCPNFERTHEADIEVFNNRLTGKSSDLP